VKDADDGETSQAVEPDATLFVTPTGFVTTSFGGETALSLTRQLAATVQTPASLGADEVGTRMLAVLGIEMPRGQRPAARVLATIRKPGYRAEQFEFTSDREIRTPGWLLTPDNAGPSTPTVLYIGEASAWSSVAEDAFAERLCGKGGCRVAVIDVRGRGGYNRGIREPDGPRFDEPRIVFGACAGAALYRRTLFDDIGLFDERFFLSWEDVDLDLRAALAGHRCLYVPSAIVHHAQGASSGEWRAAFERRNKAILALKGLPLPLLALYLALLPAREAYETRAAREGVTGYLRRLAPYASEAPRALRLRGEVRRRTGLRELWPLLTRDSLPYEPVPSEDP
jgi:hypothetical protein